MAAARDAHKAHVLHVAVQRHFAVHLEDDGAFKLIQRHARLQRIQPLLDLGPFAHVTGILEVLLALRIEGVRRVHVDVGGILGHHGEGPVVIHVFVRLNESGNFAVGEHVVYAFALEAFLHPVVVPAAVEQILGLGAVHGLDFHEAGKSARVVGVHGVFLGDGPGFVELPLLKVGLDLGHAFVIGALAYALAVAERGPVVGVLIHEQTARAGDVLHEDAVVEPAGFRNVGHLHRLAHAEVGHLTFHLGQKGPAHGRVGIKPHGSKRAGSDAERCAFEKFASVHKDSYFTRVKVALQMGSSQTMRKYRATPTRMPNSRPGFMAGFQA